MTSHWRSIMLIFQRKIPTPWICIVFLRVCEPRELIIPGWWDTERNTVCFAVTFSWCFLSQWCSNNSAYSKDYMCIFESKVDLISTITNSRNPQSLSWKHIYSCTHAGMHRHFRNWSLPGKSFSSKFISPPKSWIHFEVQEC